MMQILLKGEFLGKPKDIKKDKKKKKRTLEKIETLKPTVTAHINPSLTPSQINI